MNSVQERLAKLGMGVNDAGLTEEQSFRNDAGQAVYTGAALPDTPPISLTSEINKLEAADAAGGGGSPQAQSIDGLISSPEIQFQEEELFETTHSDPEKAMNGEDEVVGVSSMVPNKLTKEQQAEYDAKLNKLKMLQTKSYDSQTNQDLYNSLDHVENGTSLSKEYNKTNPTESSNLQVEAAALEKDIHEMKYNKEYFNNKNTANPVAGEQYNSMQNYMNGNFGEEVEVAPKVTGDEKLDNDSFTASNAYITTPLTFEGPKAYMNKKGVKTIDDPTKAMLLAFEGVTGDSTKKADTKAYGMKAAEYNELKKKHPKMNDEELFDAMYVNKRNAVRGAHDRKFGGGAFDSLDPVAKSVIMLAGYRGDYVSKHKWPKLIQDGNYKAAADEILRHGNARDSKKNKEAGVLKRFYTYYRLLNSIQPAEQ